VIEKIELQQNLKTEYYALRDLLFVTIFWIPASFIFILYIPSLIGFISMIASYMVLFFIPTIYLHNNYEKYSKGKNLLIFDKIINFDEKSISFDSIKSIKAIGTGYSLGLNYFARMTHMTGYYYLEITTIEDEKIILTSLLSKDIMKIISEKIPSIKIELNPIFYPIIKNYC